MESKTPTWDLLYFMLADELKVLEAYIEKILDKCFIWANFSTIVFSVLFVKKLHDNLYFCVDYWALNAMTIKNGYLLPLIKETLEQVCSAKVFS